METTKVQADDLFGYIKRVSCPGCGCALSVRSDQQNRKKKITSLMCQNPNCSYYDRHFEPPRVALRLADNGD